VKTVLAPPIRMATARKNQCEVEWMRQFFRGKRSLLNLSNALALGAADYLTVWLQRYSKVARRGIEPRPLGQQHSAWAKQQAAATSWTRIAIYQIAK
jgi:hypothetical protein